MDEKPSAQIAAISLFLTLPETSTRISIWVNHSHGTFGFNQNDVPPLSLSDMEFISKVIKKVMAFGDDLMQLSA